MGIEAFVNLSQLRCENNNLSSLDISTLTGLTQVRCANNSLTNLDVTNNTALTQVRFQNNDISSIDLSANIALTRIYAQGNTLTSLDVSANTALVNLQIQNNSINDINVLVNTLLTNLRVHNNNLTSLDVSANTVLSDLRCQGNDIISLDVSSNTVLTQLRCQNNNLTVLNAKNGNNASMTTFIATNNSSLTCIEVDDVAFADANFNKDATATFSTDCATLSVEGHKLNPSKVKLYPNPLVNILNIESETLITNISIYSILGKEILNTSYKPTLSLLDLQAGIYLIKLTLDDSKNILKKIVKH